MQHDLERRILYGLAQEWELALWVLPARQRALLKKPFFSLRDLKATWGSWSGVRREICLNRQLPLYHSWDSVREVLLHEMAHQFAEEVMGAHAESAHGPGFKEACKLLRANPRASGNGSPLDKRLAGPDGDAADPVIRRARKLMALAQSRNTFEAEAAMAKCHALLSKYQRRWMGEDREAPYVSAFVGRPALRHPKEDYILARLIQEFYFIQGIWVPAFVLAKNKTGRVLEISGRAENVRMARYVFDFVKNHIQVQWTVYKKERKLKGRLRAAFAAGLVKGFHDKLTRQKRPVRGHAPMALIPHDDPLLRKYMAYRYPRVRRTMKPGAYRDERVWNDGKVLGENLILAKGIEEKAKTVSALLRKGPRF